MANPQLEDGFMRVANGIVDNICKLSLNGTEQKVIWCVIRYTYGFNRKSHRLSASFISQWANCDISSVKRALRRLQKMNIIVCINSDKRGVTAELKFNKNPDQWKLTGGRNDTSVKNDTGGEISTGLVAETPLELVAELPPKKEQIIKTNIKTKSHNDFFEKIWKSYPRKLGKSDVTQKAKKELYEAGEEVVLRAINSYISEIQENGTAEKYIMYGSTFFNSRWRDYVREPEVQFETKEESEEPVDYSNVEMGW